MTPVFLGDFRSHRPDHRGDQAQILDWLATAHARAEAQLNPTEDPAGAARVRKLVHRFGCSTDRIRSRDSFLEDFTHEDWARMRIFDLDRYPAGRPCGERSRFYDEVCGRVFEAFYAGQAAPPAAILHVTCTGYAAPSGAQRLVARRGWGQTTEVIHAYHMGCYAALPAIRLAAGLVERGAPAVDLVHTELCTLHLDPTRHAPEQLVTQTLFADGAIRYTAHRVRPPGRCLEVRAGREEILSGTEADMTWRVDDAGMAMTLSRQVPGRIRDSLEGFLGRLARAGGTEPGRLRAEARFAIHPGGPRIIDEIGRHLGLAPRQVEASDRVLRERGNMSSATLPHVWQALLEDPGVADGTPVVALAFGPGLTLAGALLDVRG